MTGVQTCALPICDTLAVGRGVVMNLLEREKVDGLDDKGNHMLFWHVELEGYIGYVSAGSVYTTPIY